jgi:hypothetical protein
LFRSSQILSLTSNLTAIFVQYILLDGNSSRRIKRPPTLVLNLPNPRLRYQGWPSVVAIEYDAEAVHREGSPQRLTATRSDFGVRAFLECGFRLTQAEDESPSAEIPRRSCPLHGL